LSNAIIQFGHKIENVDRLIDGLSKTRKYMAAVRIITKIDTVLDKKRLDKMEKDDVILMSADKNVGIDEFKEKVWLGLGLVRVFLKKERNMEADKNNPLIMKNNSSLDDVLKRISSQMRDDVNRAYIWGKSAKFPGQEVSFKFLVFDEMEVYFGR